MPCYRLTPTTFLVAGAAAWAGHSGPAGGQSPLDCARDGLREGEGDPELAEGPRGSWQSVDDRLRAANAERREEITQAVTRLVRINTVRQATDPQTNQEGVDEALAFIQELSAELGLPCRNFGPGRVGLVEVGEGKEVVGVLCHLDVVPAGEGWGHDAFSGAIVDDVVWGRGTQDDKGPLVSALYAFKAVAELGAPFRRRARLIIGTQEETADWSDLEAYFATEAPPDMSFVPDALFPVINAEKGFSIVTVEWEAPQAAAGRQPKLIALHAGEAFNVVPDRAWAALDAQGMADEVAEAIQRYTTQNQAARLQLVSAAELPPELEDWRRRTGIPARPPPAFLPGLQADCFIKASGQTAHAATPAEGHSALLDLCELLAELDLAASGPADFAGFVAKYVGQELDGRSLGIARDHDVMGATTVNLGLVRTEGARCSGTFNVRFPLGLTRDEILSALRTAADRHHRRLGRVGGEVRVSQGTALDPLYVPPDLEIVRVLREVYTSLAGQKAELLAVGGTTYAKAVPNAVSFGPMMPGEERLEHAANERVAVDSLVRNADLFAAALARLCLETPEPSSHMP